MESTRTKLGLWIILVCLFSLSSHSALARRQESLRISGQVPTSVETKMSFEGKNGLWISHNAKKMALTVSVMNSDKSVVIGAFSGQNFLPLLTADNNSSKPMLVELASP